MALRFKHTALDVIARALDALLRPAALITPSQWGTKLTVPDGPRAGEKWDPSFTPYIVEPLDNMGDASPVNKQSIKKSAQTGFSMMAIVGVGHSIDCDPAGGIMLVQPTQDALDKFIRDKFNPTVENTPALKAKVAPQVARSGEGSTAYNKRYPGGSLAMVIANSTAALRSITKKRRIKDEASEYPADLDGQGSPHAMIAARGISFLASGDWKETNISTPTIKGACYIDEEFQKGDQRFWHVPCPGCSEKFVFRFGPSFRFNDAFPYAAHYVAPCCGSIIEGHQKNELVRKGEWIALAPAPGKDRSYHFDALSSPMVPWDHIAKEWIDAQANPSLLKAFYNLTLGEAYEIKGDAPDHKRLMERREDYRKGHIPPRGLMLVGAADVQMRGIYVEIVAFAPNRESWVVYADVLEGDTTDANAGAFLKLADLYRREWPDAFGNKRQVDAFGVDTGFRSHVVYHWCSSRHLAYALDGRDGWTAPPLGTGAIKDIDLDGNKVGIVKLWPVGTWSLKAHWYEDLRREGRTAGHEVDPPGFCHFGMWLDEVYFKQVTAEYLAEKTVRGRKTKAWEVRGNQDNHFLDCRVYNYALAEHLGLSSMTAEEWKLLARERAPTIEQGDLFAPKPLAVQVGSPAAVSTPAVEEARQVAAPDPQQSAEAPRQAEPTGGGWIGRDTSGWLSR
ncbi:MULTISPECIES: phage terminase large subunit family protein [unclassified Bradyrhizobium]|uniref:phage terminase large subunit family protein n=1 Tax=unclassified Bradyrhizobium TaxID=2631580 RepID=UPI0029164852|nr:MULTISPECIES: terminase gpA endonuclease subunit [unclassified Bradyrhizobium]